MATSRTYPAHFEKNKRKISFAVVTVSDSCFKNEKEDLSGPTLKALIQDCKEFSGTVVVSKCVPDDVADIKAALLSLCDDLMLNVVITTGGTGFSHRDVTPEATMQILEKQAPGIMTAMTLNSLQSTIYSMLSRAVCGIRKNTLIINLPGSVKAVKECFQVFSPVLEHAVDLLVPASPEVDKTKKKEQASSSSSTDSKCSHGTHDNQVHYTAPFLVNWKMALPPTASNPTVKSDVLDNSELEQMLVADTVTSCVKTDNVAKRPRKSQYSLLTVDEALACISHHSPPIGTVQRTVDYNDLDQVIGHVLAEDICATSPHPPFSASIKDGYAIIASDGKGVRKVIDTSIAGSIPDSLVVNSGTCIRINTGAPIPKGADAVIQVEDTNLISNSLGEETEIEILKESKVGQDIRPIGSDIQQGAVVVPKYSVIGAGELGAAATIGRVSFNVYEKPKIAVLTTGNEIVDPSSSPKRGQIRDSNKIQLMSFFKSKGFHVTDAKIAADHPDDVLRHLRDALANCHVLLITGGMSMGEKDYVKEVLKQDLKAEIHFGRVFMKPGKPTTFATVMYEGKKKLIFGLPGNPVSALVTAQLFVLPAVLSMSGHQITSPTTVKAKIQITKKLDERPEYMRGRVTWVDGGQVAVVTNTTANQISSNVCSLVGANALVALPPSSHLNERIEAGEFVEVLYTGHV